MFVPGIAFAGPVLTIARSAEAPTGTTSVPVLFPGVTSPPPLTSAVFVMLLPADCRTLTVTEIAGQAAPAARTSAREHETFGAVTVQAQPVAVAAVGVRPAGSVSVTVTGAFVGPRSDVRNRECERPRRAADERRRRVRLDDREVRDDADAARGARGVVRRVRVDLRLARLRRGVRERAGRERGDRERERRPRRRSRACRPSRRPSPDTYAPCDGAAETKPMFAGRTSVTTTPFAVDGPLFVAVTVNVKLCATSGAGFGHGLEEPDVRDREHRRRGRRGVVRGVRVSLDRRDGRRVRDRRDRGRRHRDDERDRGAAARGQRAEEARDGRRADAAALARRRRDERHAGGKRIGHA